MAAALEQGKRILLGLSEKLAALDVVRTHIGSTRPWRTFALELRSGESPKATLSAVNLETLLLNARPRRATVAQQRMHGSPRLRASRRNISLPMVRPSSQQLGATTIRSHADCRRGRGEHRGAGAEGPATASARWPRCSSSSISSDMAIFTPCGDARRGVLGAVAATNGEAGMCGTKPSLGRDGCNRHAAVRSGAGPRCPRSPGQRSTRTECIAHAMQSMAWTTPK